jgi:hypothetical protein
MIRGRCLSVAPIMPTTDIERTVQHYERLGFTVNVVETGFAMAKRDEIELFFSLNPDHDPRRTAACIYIRIEDADALNKEWAAAGVPGLREPRNTDYKMREFPHIDPDNNLILFGSRLAGHEA